ncbi:MAG: hypothetical protein RBS88_07505 [Spongiibacteraceae bacterium]|jgi:hypothetical protein|nr:hypothetical protein [Spongiibacteraceae bacterium]
MNRDTLITAAVVGGIFLVVLVCSATLGGERAMVPRDWVPPLAATICLIAVKLFRKSPN